MTTFRQRLTYLFIAAATVIIYLLSVFGMSFTAYAATYKYTDVLADLSKDEAFDATAYPEKAKDYRLNVIQVAESSDKELFVYIYIPCALDAVSATSINISRDNGKDPKFANYSLTLLNRNGVFAKYVVNNFTVTSESERYYNISSVFRAYDKNIDTSPPEYYDNVIAEVAFPVGQLWTVNTFNGKVSYAVKEIEVIQVTSQMIGFRRYSDGFAWSGIEYCDAHYVAFSCDHNIDKLLSADLQFYTQSYEKLEGQDLALSDDKKMRSVTIHDYDKGASSKEQWSRMASMDEFFSEVEVTLDEKQSLSQYDWILNFYETEYERDFGGKDIVITLLVPGGFIWSIINACTTSGVIVSEVSLMRLEFEYGGNIYNLGVVSNKQTGGLEPSNPYDPFSPDLGFDFVLLIKLLAVLVVVIILLPLLIPLLGYLFRFLAWLITAPFKAIGKLFKKR